MRHEIDPQVAGPATGAMTAAIEACVHCGFCLPTCPTYVTLGEEMDSPRGRIVLMKEVLEGGALEPTLPFIDNCLGCQACETACPSGVAYGELITPFRAYAEEHRTRPIAGRVPRELALRTLPYPRRFRFAARLGALARPLAAALPSALQPMVRLLPARVPRARRLPAIVPARGELRARVALLAGCAQQVLAPQIGAATARVLAHNGVEVVIGPSQGCCGALALHAGAADQARALARGALRAFAGTDAVVTNAAGCGSGMREYGLLFAGEPEEDEARALAARVVDVSVLLADLGLREPPALARPATVAYQDACHLLHAQRVHAAPRTLLSAITGVTLVEPSEPGLCCGSAGIYNVERPDVARELGARKAAALIATGADVVATGNVGCLTQVTTHLREAGSPIAVRHTIELLDRAYAGKPLA